FDPFGGGSLDVWRDGVQLVDYNGPLAYNDKVGPYLKQGVYRETASEAFAVQIRNVQIAEGTGSSQPAPKPQPTEPTPTPQPQPQPEPNDPEPTDPEPTDPAPIPAPTGNTISGTSGNDRLYGTSGD